MTPPFFSIIIPVHNAASLLEQCLASLAASSFTDWELIVADDHSTDGSAAVAQRYQACLLATEGRSGPAAARNLAASHATGRYLFFLDADCELHTDTLAKAAVMLQVNPELDALFGSYDDSPAAPAFVSQYKNLFHHYIHQTSNPVATTFWAGCGAMRRTTFLALGGFDAHRYPRPAVEDIELGYRLTQAGGRIRLAREVQVKHLKRWTLATLLQSDIRDRALPWARLLLQYPGLTRADLNLKLSHRLTVLALYATLLFGAIALFQPYALFLMLFSSALILYLNKELYTFFRQKRGLVFALRAVSLHWLYYLYSAPTVAWACSEHLIIRLVKTKKIHILLRVIAFWLQRILCPVLTEGRRTTLAGVPQTNKENTPCT